MNIEREPDATSDNLLEHVDTECQISTQDLGNVKFIPRKYIPKGKITLEHARRCIGVGENLKPEEKLVQLNQIKDQAKQWFQHETKKLVTEQIQLKNLFYKKVIGQEIRKFPVRNLTEFEFLIEQDSSEKMMKIIFDVTYGYFDRNFDWNLELETKFMLIQAYQYSQSKTVQHRSKEKGCFEILCSAEKTEIVKRFQRVGKRSHGRYMSIERPKKQNGQYSKRRPGVWYSDFVKTDTSQLGKVSNTSRQCQVRRTKFILLNVHYIYID